ncbi:MAG: PQQ-like beta-propeller repeat protein [Gemmataceae bacterium]|nr:PQQ-like beta-propeller repeat protein [Gemmataceae bacterium]
MKTAATRVIASCALLICCQVVRAQDWPQWRGPNRDNHVAGFTAPAAWPKELSRKWSTPVGQGDSSPVLVGDKIYVLGRQGDEEVISCLDASSGKILWQDKYASEPAAGAAGGPHAGPRATPAVAEGKVCTFGVRGILSCLDANTAKVHWRKDTKLWPTFFTAASPVIVDGKCIAYIGGGGMFGKGGKGGKGGGGKGEIVAFNLATGEPTWTWTGDSPAYGSPVLATIHGVKQIITPTVKSLVGIDFAGGKQLWQFDFASKQNTGSPIIDRSTVIYTGPPDGTVAFSIERENNKFTTKELWRSKQSAHRYNTPVLKDGFLYGLTTGSNFYCMSAKTGDVLWTDKERRGECGAILSAGRVLLALTSDQRLIAFQPSEKDYAELARYDVAESPTWAYPIVAGKRVYVKDQNSITQWTMD